MCLVAQSCVTLCNPVDCGLPGSSVHGDSPGKNTGVGCMPSSRGSSQPRDRTQVSCIAGGFFTNWATRETPKRITFLNTNNAQLEFEVKDAATMLLFSQSVMSDSLWPHGLKHGSLPCPSPFPRACLSSCPLSRWYHPTFWGVCDFLGSV